MKSLYRLPVTIDTGIITSHFPDFELPVRFFRIAAVNYSYGEKEYVLEGIHRKYPHRLIITGFVKDKRVMK